MRIQNNIMAMNTHRFYTMNNNSVQKSAEKLSSGYRVNRAGDDAAGLAISEKMRAEIRGLSMASKNSQDGVSMVQTAEGALTEVQAMLQRMKELAVQAASDSNENEIDRPALDQEFQQLIKEIDDVAMTTTFNDMKLLDGSFQNKVIQIGSRTGNEMDISIGDMSAKALGLAGGTAGAAGVPTIEGLDLTEEAATKGKDVAGAAMTAATAAVDGGKFALAVNYTDADGNEQTARIEMTLKKDTESETDKFHLVAADGTKYDVADTTGKAVTAPELGKAFAAELNKDAGISETFKVTVAADTGVLTFNNRVAGAASKVNSLMEDSGKGTSTTVATPDKQIATTNTAGTDAYEYVDFSDTTSYKVGDVFSVGGQDFAFVKTQEAAVALGADVNAVVVADGATVAEDDVAAMQTLIEQKTGYKPTQGTDSTTATANGTGTFMLFKSPEGTTGSAGEVNLLTQGTASVAIDKCRDALNQVSTQRAELGAIQNRLEHKIKNLDNTVENVSAAEARIRDVDIAKEMTNFTKNQILSQAATAMLAQANSLPQNVLSLLQ